MAKTINKIPQVSVVMSVYNGAQYLDSAIRSILAQSFKDFEFIIVNDGSTDNSLAIINSYIDKRITIINQDNKGLVSSLNRAIAASKADIIARQDADDISETSRLEEEYDILYKNKNTVIVGSSITTIDESDSILNIHKVLVGNAELKQELLIRSPFAHGSVMFRKAAFLKAGGYKKSDWPAEDYALWLRMSEFGDFNNIDSPLYRYRENSNGISANNVRMQNNKKNNIRDSAWYQRRYLIKDNINIEKYLGLEMGSYRVDRIIQNLLTSLGKSIVSFRLITSLRLIKLIISDRRLLRGSVRLLLIRLK